MKRLVICCLIFGATLPAACGDKPGDAVPANRPPTTSATPPAVNADELVARWRALDTSRDSLTRARVTIREEGGAGRQVQVTIRRKRQADGGQVALIEFTSPPEERDRNGLIKLTSGGDIEATRYVQSTDSFSTVTSPANEDSLFGLSLQELADGQTEKYTYQVVGEEQAGATPVYRVEGRLKPDEESKFPRLVLLLSKENNAVLAMEYYDPANQLARRLTVEKTEEVGGIPTRKRWTVDNRARQKKLDFEVLEVKYNQGLPDALFTREHLKKTAMK